MRVALYIRVSTEEQAEEGYSLDAQERAGRLYAELHGWQVVDVYKDEGFSGRTSERPQLARLNRDIQAGKIQKVIVHKLDRLARNLQLMLELINDWDKRGVSFASISEQMDFSTPIGRMVLQMLGAVAEWYSNNLAVETAKGMAEKARQGYWIGPVPFGYRMEYTVDGEGNRVSTGVLVPAEEEAEIVLEIYTLYATGIYSFAEIADMVNRRGITVMDWKRRGRHPFGEYSVRSILNNRAYLGYVSCADVEYPGKHQPLISQELWDEVQAMRVHRRRRGAFGRTGVPDPAILSGLIYCASCGEPMWYHPRGSGEIRRRYYTCSGRRARTCKAKSVSADQIEAQVAELMRGLVLTEQLQETLARRMLMLSEQQRAKPAVDKKSVEARLKRLSQLYEDGFKTEEEYSAERDALRALLAEANLSLPTVAADVRTVAAQLADVPRLYELATPAEKSVLIGRFFSHLWVEPHKLAALTPRGIFCGLLALCRETTSRIVKGTAKSPRSRQTHKTLSVATIRCRQRF